MTSFGQRDVAVILKGEQWATLIAVLTGMDLLPPGQATYDEAVASMHKQLLQESRKVEGAS